MIRGITFSAFDLCHPGHILMLEEAKENCDYLMVGLQIDPTINRPEKNRPIQSIVERYIQLKGCKYVDEIIPYTTEDDLEQILMSIPINIRFIGEDYLEKDFTGKLLCDAMGIEVFYNRRQHDFSTSELRSRIEKGGK